ncbi:hypothetical protein GJAV_G00047510 [Gymnothorax javanicus]|nr:hypothetical protein GJAV_G00047510 [Gymnothorax javanicus]
MADRDRRAPDRGPCGVPEEKSHFLRRFLSLPVHIEGESLVLSPVNSRRPGPFLFLSMSRENPTNRTPQRRTSRRNMASSMEISWPVPMKAIGAQNLLTMPGGVSQSGYLHKKGGSQFSLLRWPLRFIIIHKGCVYYFKSSTSPSPQGAFSLMGYNRVLRAAEETTSSNVFPFKIVHFSKKHRTWYFSAASEEERKNWMLRLRQEIDYYHDKKDSQVQSDSDSDGDSFYGHVERPLNINYSADAPEEDYVIEDDEDDEEDYLQPDETQNSTEAPTGKARPVAQKPTTPHPPTGLPQENSPPRLHHAGPREQPLCLGSTRTSTLPSCKKGPPPIPPNNRTRPQQDPLPAPPTAPPYRPPIPKPSAAPKPAPFIPTKPKPKPQGSSLQRTSPDGQSFRSSVEEMPANLQKKLPHTDDSDGEDYENVQLPDSVFVDTTDTSDVEKLFKETTRSPQDGLYCIRNSGTKTSKVLVVWDVGLKKARNYRLFEENSRIFLETDITFPSLAALVEHYYSHALPNHSSLCLQKPYGYTAPR